MFIASGIGAVVSHNATVAGAVGGCQAECGTAAAMAAAAAASMAGGSNDTILQAFALCLKNTLGLACDPVAGLVEVPCVKRNAVFAVEALAAAEMALAGIKSVIPPDEVIAAMAEIGRIYWPGLSIEKNVWMGARCGRNRKGHCCAAGKGDGSIKNAFREIRAMKKDCP